MSRTKKNKINEANILLEQRENETSFKDEITNLLRSNLNEGKELITESLVIDIMGWIKTALTSHRVGELLTSLVKIIYKWLGIDKNMDGIKDKCQKSEDQTECTKMSIQKFSEWLHSIHEKLMKPIEFLSACIKFKTLKPSEEQRQQSKKFSEGVFKAVILGCLVYYLKNLGVEISDGNWGLATFYFGGSMVKLSELLPKWESAIHFVYSSTGGP